jgi:hypothetical protein
MTIIFKAKTGEGYALKVLAELLQNNIFTPKNKLLQHLQHYDILRSYFKLKLPQNVKNSNI